MMHSQIEQAELVERYARHRLLPEEQQAFEEHFFDCEECFEKVQEAERFQAAVRDASERGLLDDESRAGLSSRGGTWLLWALTATACASVAFVAIAGWMYFVQIPTLRGELDREAAQLKLLQARPELPQTANPSEGAEANVALVMLQASRAGEKPPTATLLPGARRLVLWIEIGQSQYRSFRMDAIAPGNRVITSLDHLERGPYGALAASLPVDTLPTGDVRITLSGQDPPPASLVGDYQLRIERR